MLSEIGSNFWEYSLEKKHEQNSFFWMNGEYHVQYYKSGRNAIKALSKNLKGKKKSVLIPAYTCETVIQPFLDEGWKVSYYSVNMDLSLNEESLLRAYESEHPSAVFVQTYFGFNTIAKDQIVLDCKNDGAIIIEDLTQSLFSNHYIEYADYYVTSFRKFLAVPDGGALISKNELCDLEIKGADTQIKETALVAFDLKRQYFQSGMTCIKSAFRKKYVELNHLIAENTHLQSINTLSYEIICNCDQRKIKIDRQKNYKNLAKAFQHFETLKSVISSNIEGCAPLYYPIYVDDRKLLQDYMASENIFCPIIWPKPSMLTDIDDDLQYMYEHMLCIPIDQRYSCVDMNRIVSVLKNFYQK